MIRKIFVASKIIPSILFMMLVFVFFACSEKKQLPETNEKDSIKTLECFSDKDTAEIATFFQKMDSYFCSNDTENVIQYIRFPLDVDGEEVDDIKFRSTYYTYISKYLIKNRIPKDELSSLERIVEFVKMEHGTTCYQYFISNSFSELEFSVDIYIEKINGAIKIISLSIIG